MAKVKIEMPSGFMDQIAGMGNVLDEAIPKALAAGGKVVMEKMKSNLQAAIGRGTKTKSRSTGTLAASLGVSPSKLDRDGNLDVKVGFSEGRGEVSNAMLANILEYGKHGQPPKPFLKQTKSSSRKPCIEAMQTTLKEELDLP
ncbi:MAG: HK97-gp10 family putative phage morphogenesis protein [Christensenella sp.]|nr:HK97-gp10 family putative phage morphogenesis protein [Christensenella sp.]